MISTNILSCLIGAAAGVATLSSTPNLASFSLTWDLLPTGSQQRFRGLSPLSDKIAWVAGTNGTVLRTTDGGLTWEEAGPKLSSQDAELEFRDIETLSAAHVVLLSIGTGNASRIYVTKNVGGSWAQAFTNDDPDAFYDCIAFSSGKHGIGMSDPVEGKFRLVETVNGGESWAVLDPAGMPAAKDGEFGFAASGTCLTAGPGNRMYLASGGVNPGRVFYSEDDGHDWEVTDTPVAGGDAAGVFSVQFRDQKHGIAVGGDYTVANVSTANAAWSSDGGKTWTASEVFPHGYRSGSAWVPGFCGTAVAVGPTGSDITFDGGKTWRNFDNGSFDSVQCPRPGICWASGIQGRVAKLRFH